MPYGISNNQPDCEGWATVKVDGDVVETIFCHPTKQDAIDQMIAASLSEDLEPLGEVRELRQDSYAPTAAMKEEAQRGLDWRAEFNRGGTEVGVARARDIINGRDLSLDTVKRMRSYFARHEVDKQGQGWSPDEDGYPSAGRIAWALWGGDPGRTWADNIVEQNEERNMDEEQDLSAHQSSLYEAYEWIAESFGKFDQGIGAQGAHYVAESPFAEDGLVCSNCVFFEGGRACEVVDGDIAPEGICKLWIIKADLVDGEAEAEEEPMSESEDMIDETDVESNGIEVRWATEQVEKRQIAYTNLELRMEGEEPRFMGYAAMWDSPSEPLPWTEFVRRGAFSKTINDGADVRLLVNHEGVPLARTKSGTMTLTEDERGLWVEADLDPANPLAAGVISAIRRGDMTQMSFAFETIKDSWSDDRRTRELREVRLYDVSIVTYPAYEQTIANIRSRINTEGVTVPTTPLALRKAQISLARRRAAH